MTIRYAYYPGCASHSITKEADRSTRQVARLLGIELVDMPGANCCGAGLATDYDRELSVALNARIFAQAQRMRLDIMTICSTCFMVMRTANKELTQNAALLENTNEILAEATGDIYDGGVETKHLLWVLIEDYGLNKLKRKVKRPLKGLKVAPFYGCHTLRPSDALGLDDPRTPHSLDRVIEALGGEVARNRGQSRCCGFQVDLVNEHSAVGMTGMRLIEAKDEGAEIMVTPCPFCHINMDGYQNFAEKSTGRDISLPVLHLAQLVGFALGMEPGELGLARHMVSSEGILGAKRDRISRR